MKCTRSYAPLGLFVGLALLFQVGTVWAALDFEFGQTFAVGKRASTIDAGDLDGDGDLDLATANIFSHSITIAWNDGTGRFSELQEIPLNMNMLHPIALTIGDLDGENNLDLVVAHLQDWSALESGGGNSEIILFFAEEDGSYFQLPIPINGVPSSVEIADINNDGDNDILVGNNGEFVLSTEAVGQFDGGVYPYINQGGRLFTKQEAVVTDIGSIVDIETFDVDLDGNLDVVGVNQGSLGFDSNFNLALTDFDISVFLNGGGELNFASTKVLNLQPWSLDAADFDGDQQTDIAVSIVGDMEFISFLGTNASVDLFRNENGRFDLMKSIPTPGVAFAVMAEDFDLDNDIDLAVTVQELEESGAAVELIPTLRLYENDGENNFTETGVFDLQEEPRYAVADDFDNDGDIDLAIVCTIQEADNEANAYNGQIYVFFNNASTGDGSLRTLQTFPFDSADEYTHVGGGYSVNPIFPSGEAAIAELPWAAAYTDGLGAALTVSEGQVSLLQFPPVSTGMNTIALRASVRSAGPNAQFALVALDGSMDGSIATNIPANSAPFEAKYTRQVLVYDPPGNSIVPVVQAAGLTGADQERIYVDNLEIFPIPKDGSYLSALLYGIDVSANPTDEEIPLTEVFEFNSADEFTPVDGGYINADAGFISTGKIPTDVNEKYTDGTGVTVTTLPGQVELLQLPTVDVGENLALVRVSVQSNGPGAQVALAVLDGSMDGSIATNIPVDSSVFQSSYNYQLLVYDPPGTSITPVIQVANIPGEQVVSVFFDRLEVYTIPEKDLPLYQLLYGK